MSRTLTLLLLLCAVAALVPETRAQHFRPSYPYARSQAHWGCFGYCPGPLTPRLPSSHWGCFGYCPGPITPTNHYYTCFGYCPTPLPTPHWTCYGYCPYNPVPSSVYVPSPYPYPVPSYSGNSGFALDPSIFLKDVLNPSSPTPPVTQPSPSPLRVDEKKPGKSVAELIQALDDPNARTRGQAAAALGQLGLKAKSAIPPLVNLLKDADPYVRLEAGQALARIGPDAIPALLGGLKSDNRYLRMGAALTLGHLGTQATDAIPALKLALKDGDLRVRCHAAQALWRITEQTGDSVPVLAAALEQAKDDSIKLGAIATLSLMGQDAKSAEAALKKALKDPEGQVRRAAALALYRVDPNVHSSAAVAPLVEMLKDAAPEQRAEAAAILGGMGPDAKTAIPALATALRDDNSVVRTNAALALSHLGTAAVPALLKAYPTSKGEMRQTILASLAGIGPEAQAAVPDLVKLMEDGKELFLRLVACKALGSIGPGAKEAVPALIKMLSAPEYSMRRRAAETLGRIGPAARPAEEALRRASRDDDDDLQDLAREALRRINR